MLVMDSLVRFPCSLLCGAILMTDKERLKHERVCSKRVMSCCQKTSSCKRQVQLWLSTDTNTGLEQIELCQHQSNGVFGAIREDNIDLLHYYLNSVVRYPILHDLLLHETCFGDTLLIFAVSLGRLTITKAILNYMLDCVCENQDIISLTDFVDYESRRGKVALVEAIRNSHYEIVELLLSHNAKAEHSSKTHKKSAIEWAKALGKPLALKMISERLDLEHQVKELFHAISKFDVEMVKALTIGGVPYKRFQNESFQREIDEKRQLIATNDRSVKELTEDLRREESTRDNLMIEIHSRSQRVELMQLKRQEIINTRQKAVMDALATVSLASTSRNITHTLNSDNPSVEHCLIAKGLCILLHLKVTSNNDDTTIITDNKDFLYWIRLKGFLKEKSSFEHRLRHYNFDPVQVGLAAKAQVSESSRTYSEWIHRWLEGKNDLTGQNSDNSHDPKSVLITSLARWINAIFQNASGYQIEKDLIMEESLERTMLEKSNINLDVLVSRCAILRREVDENNKSILQNTSRISEFELRLRRSKVLSFVASNGHTALSWAMSAGNKVIAFELMKHGAHTVIGEDCITWSAIVIQLCFHRYLSRKLFRRKTLRQCKSTSLEAYFEQKSQDIALSLRISSLNNLIRKRCNSLRLPLMEALFNGNAELVNLLRGPMSDITLFQAINMISMFQRPCCKIPRAPLKDPYHSSTCCFISSIISCLQYQYQSSKSCVFISSLRSTVALLEDYLMRRRQAVETKIAIRRATLIKKYWNR